MMICVRLATKESRQNRERAGPAWKGLVKKDRRQH